MTDSTTHNKRNGILLACAAALLWSGNYIVARGIHAQIAPVSLAFLRWLTATAVLFPFAYRPVRRDMHSLRMHWKTLALTAILGISLFNTFIYIAGKWSTAINLAIIGTTVAPIFVVLLAWVILRERPTANRIVGMLICLVGILLLLTNGRLQELSNLQFNRGDLWMLGAALAFAAYTLLVRRKPQETSPLSYLFTLFLLGTVFLLPFFLFENKDGLTFTPSWRLLFVFLYLGIGASVGAFLCWNMAIQKIGAPGTALFANLIPVFSSIEAVLFLQEDAGPVLAVSLLVILFGVLLANREAFKKGGRG